MMNKLFIYIPTFNRPNALKKQLNVLFPQVAAQPDRVRLIVNDNASDDDWVGEIEAQYAPYSNIQFRTNSGNIGGNANISIGFMLARPDEFLWILSDNDIVTDTAVDYLIGFLNEKIDFFCFVDTIEKPIEVRHAWTSGWQTPMDWRMGLISDALYNINTVKNSLEDAFYYHNSSFPHLAVACSAAKKKEVVTFMLLPRGKINREFFLSHECPTDYSLAYAGMPLLVPLFPPWEAKEFSLKWLHEHGVDLCRHKSKHIHVYQQTRAVLTYYGGWAARINLIWSWAVYLLASISGYWIARQKCIDTAKRHLSHSALEKLKSLRRFVCRK